MWKVYPRKNVGIGLGRVSARLWCQAGFGEFWADVCYLFLVVLRFGHDSKTSTPVPDVFFFFPKNPMVTTPDPYNRVMNFFFSTPAGGGIWRLARQDPEAKKSHSQGLTP